MIAGTGLAKLSGLACGQIETVTHFACATLNGVLCSQHVCRSMRAPRAEQAKHTDLWQTRETCGLQDGIAGAGLENVRQCFDCT
jgi:hypothetical protein